jgi:hypothetical protein
MWQWYDNPLVLTMIEYEVANTYIRDTMDGIDISGTFL